MLIMQMNHDYVLCTINIYIQFDRIGLIYLWNNQEGVFRLESLIVLCRFLDYFQATDLENIYFSHFKS